MFGNEGFYTTMTLFTLIGSHAGLNILFPMIQKYYNREVVFEHIFEFTSTTFLKSILRILFIGVISVPTFIPLIVVPNDSNFTVIFIFKAAFPFCVTLAIVYSLGIFFAYKLGLTKNDFDTVTDGSKFDGEKIDLENMNRPEEVKEARID